MANEVSSVKREHSAHPVPHGGAATATGVWYQAIWTLLTAASARFAEAASTDDRGFAIQLIVEPRGGDVIVQQPDRRRVLQLKTLHHGTWSLKNVIVDVLPDLYRAVSESNDIDTFEFVTEGRIGRWDSAYRFFRSLAGRVQGALSQASVSEAWDQLDDSRHLSIGGSDADFWGANTTERAIMDRITRFLRDREAIANEPLALTRVKTWRLIGGFRFSGNRREEDIRREVDAVLLGAIDDRDELPLVRDAMVGWLIDRSKVNDAVVTPEELFAAHGLDRVIPLTRQALLHERCRRNIQELLELRGYRPDWHVDRQCAQGLDIVLAVTPDPPLVALTGESGTGKSWELFALARNSPLPAVVLLNASGDAGQDLERAASVVWQEVLGHGKPQSLSQIGARWQALNPTAGGNPWCLICIDQLHEPVEMQELLQTPFESWGVQIAVACTPSCAVLVDEHARQHVECAVVRQIGLFSTAQRNDYLQRRLGDQWVSIPADVRDLLRMPLLAGLYCTMSAEMEGWNPRSEYELVDRFYQRLISGANAAHRQDAMKLQRLAVSILDNAAYPWTDDDLASVGVDDQVRNRLMSLGWLRLNTSDQFEITHERLLNFAVARGLASQCECGVVDMASVTDRLSCMLSGSTRYGQPPHGDVNLGYVPMDWFYLLLKSERTEQFARKSLEMLHDQLHHSQRATLHAELFPTLESSAVPLQMRYLAKLAAAGQWWELDPVISGLAAQPIERLREGLGRLLGDNRPAVCRAGLRLLARKPDPSFLDRAWNLHKDMQANAAPYFSDNTPEQEVRPFLLYKDSFAALRECTRLKPTWLIQAIRCADGESDPVHDLAYLVANVGDGGSTWNKCKADLLDKVKGGKVRSLAVNAGVYCDHSFRDRLVSWIGIRDDHAGPAAVRALSRIDPVAAADGLLLLEPFDLYCCRHWFLPRLFLNASEHVLPALQEYVCKCGDPLGAVQIFQGFENNIPADALSTVLDRLDADLGEELAKQGADEGHATDKDRFYRVLDLLSSVSAPELLDVFEARAGSRFEDRLAEYMMRIGPRTSLGVDCLSRDPALDVLLKCGGAGYRRVVAVFLDAETRYGRYDAIRAARRTASKHILEKVQELAMDDELWDGAPVLQMEAMRTIAGHGDSVGLAKAGMKLGLEIPANLDEWLPQDLVHQQSEVEVELCSTVRSRSPDRCCGALLVLGLTGCDSVVTDMISIVRNPPSCEMEKAAIVALGYLKSAAEMSIPVLVGRLQDERVRDQAIQALSRIATIHSRSHLLSYLETRWDLRLAVWLTQFDDACDKAVKMIAARFEKKGSQASVDFRDELQTLLASATDQVIEQIVRSSPSVQERLREMALASEGSFWIVGAKSDAIRGLASIDVHAAFLAAHSALMRDSARDRHLYPGLMYKLRSEEARAAFLDVTSHETNAAVLWSMANALESQDSNWLASAMRDSSYNKRAAACRLAAGPGVDTPSLRKRLAALLSDPCEKIADAAGECLARLQAADIATTLVDRLEGCIEQGSQTSCWSVITALGKRADAGFKGGAWPHWYRRLVASSKLVGHSSMLQSLQVQIENRREKALRKANRVSN